MDELFNRLRKIQQEMEAKKLLEEQMQLTELEKQSMSTPAPFRTPSGFPIGMPDTESGYFVEEPSLGEALEKDPRTRYQKLKEKLNK